ncbi:TonB-dependent receptor [Brevundimonas sp.]|jgi:outer membrane receptor protein involved in Fe transport|uniref:TonB-dependent receptor n=1 Tax=Brevundimonas sp. TaxID=1871086 RepID=UPI002E0D5DF3|nr:TonB-dependent receptor [Brevundimonas sp.]
MRRHVTRSSLLLGAGALALSFAGAARAQDQEPEVTRVDDVVVTAQLREQDPVEVPFALTTYTGEFLQDLGVQEFDALSAFVPGFLVQNQSPNNPGFVMRGITSDSGEATVEPRVSVYQDGVSISKSRGSYVELFDLARVEIAKGPQSTLYGRGALIGAVNLVQNKPVIGVYEGDWGVSFGSLERANFEFASNLPIGETVAVRLAGRLKDRDGYVENLLGGPDYNGVETEAFRVSVGFEPSDAFRYDVIANWQGDEGTGTSFKSRQYFPADPATGAVLGGREPWEGAALTPRADFDGGKELGLDREVWGVTGIGEWAFTPSLTLTSITAHREFDSYETFDADGISLPVLTAAEDARGEQTSQEFRLAWDGGDRVSGFVGAAWFHEDGSQRAVTQFDERIALTQVAGLLDGNPLSAGNNTLPFIAYGNPALIDPILGGLGLPAPVRPGIRNNLKPAHIEEGTNSQELTSYDLFGDVTFRLTDRLEVAAGVRRTTDEKTVGYSASVTNGRSVLGGLLALPAYQAQINALIAQGTPQSLAQAAALGAFVNNLIVQLATPGAATAPFSAAFPAFGLGVQPTANNGDFVYQDLEDDGLTWRLTARYDLGDDSAVYANYARGRRPQVLAARPPAVPFGAPTFTPVDEETVDSFEVGYKTALNDGRLRFDGAVFHYSYENFQTTVQEGTRFITTNAGEATSYGFEGQVFWIASETFDVFGTYAFNRSRFESGIFDGNSFRLSPDHMASVGLSWRVPFAGGDLEFQPTYTWQSETFFSDDNDIPSLQVSNLVPDTAQDEVQDAYGLLNLRVRWAPLDGGWQVEAYGDNLLDEEYIKDAGNTGDGLGLPTFIAGRPLEYGVGLRIRY